MASVQLQSVSFRYPGAEQDTLQNLELDIGDGEAHALLGGSGAGKTTLLNLLSGLLHPDSGDIRFADASVALRPAAARGVAQVFQFPVLYDSLSVLDNLGLPLRTRGVGTAARNQRAGEVAALLDFAGNGFGDLARVRPSGLSLYQKQLLAIGKALVRPDLQLVLLDEPLTAVQPSLKWALRRTLKQVQREMGVTMVYVTHDQTEALTFADRVSVMRNGAIVQCGTPEQLYQAPEHSYVGFFIGSPGMNFVSATVRDGRLERDGARWPLPVAVTDGPVQIGFRPEWAALATPDPTLQNAAGLDLPGTVEQARVTGLAAGERTGLMQCAVPEAVQISGNLRHEIGAAVQLHIDRYLLFRDERQIAVVGQQPVSAS